MGCGWGACKNPPTRLDHPASDNRPMGGLLQHESGKCEPYHSCRLGPRQYLHNTPSWSSMRSRSPIISRPLGACTWCQHVVALHVCLLTSVTHLIPTYFSHPSHPMCSRKR
eukprot:2557119-Amphidinium_carterae.1